MTGRILIGLVRIYQLVVSPLLPPACRFYPTCSEYMVQAIGRHGPLHGGWLGLRRLLKCHPWHPGGVDMVPEPGQPPCAPEQHSDPLHTL